MNSQLGGTEYSVSTNTLDQTTSLPVPAAPSYPLVFAEEPFVRLAIVYNPFDLTQTAKHELVYTQNKTLADYLDGLPLDVEWRVAVNGIVAEPESWGEIVPQPFSNIALVRIPEGGGKQGKSILRIVAMVALMVFAWWAAPYVVGAAAGMGITMSASFASSMIMSVGGMVINALLPPVQPGANQKAESETYGIDGAKNTAQEGGVLPISYGEYRVAGNIVDFYTKNVGKEQYVYMRTVLNDGEIESIEDIEINDQPLSQFEDVQVRKSYGKIDETPNDWFNEASRMVNASVKIDETFQERATQSEVDRLRVDVVFPMGLYSIDQDDGTTKDARTVILELQYAPCDQNGNLDAGATWQNLPLEARQDVLGNAAHYTTPAGSTNYTVKVQTAADSGGSKNYAITGQYRLVGTTEWITAPTMTGKAQLSIDLSDGLSGLANPTWPQVNYSFNFPTAGQYEVRVTGTGAVQQGAYGNAVSATSLTIRDKTTKAKRLSFETPIMTRGHYKVRIRRTTPQQTVRGQEVDYVYDECWLTDIVEIDRDNVAMNGVANLSIRAKVSEQISGIPKVTARCKLSKVNIYDEDGTVLDFAWSDNPADIAVDILHNTRRGAGYPISKTLWSRYVEFRQHCIDNNLKFNGVFDTVSNLWEAVQSVARVGHGTVIGRGTKFSFAIDKAEEPIAVFTPANMFKDTFSKTWMGVQDRANEVQLEFQDGADGYKTKTVRLPNDAAFARGERQKIANVSGFGITSVAQAIEEAEYHVRNNQYIRSHISFDAPLESIGLNIGDVALIQHDSVDFKGGVGGRLMTGSTTSIINLDRPAPMSGGKQYVLLVVQSAVQRYATTITSKTGSRVTVTGLPDVAVSALPRISRLRQGVTDVEVYDVVKTGTGTFRLTVSDADDLTTSAATLWDVDVIEERDVVYAEGESQTVTLQTPLTQAPGQYANFLFGEKLNVRLPYRLRTIDGDDMERRTLTFVQYDDRVYQPGSWGTTTISSPPRATLNHVSYLFADFDRTASATQDRVSVTLNWQRPENTNGYGGADIYLQQSDGTWFALGSVTNSEMFVSDFSRGESPVFKVVAYDMLGNRARFADAPITATSIKVISETLAAPTALDYSVPYFRTDATANVTWTPVPDADVNTYYRVEFKKLTTAEFDAFVAAGGDPAEYAEVVTSDTGYQTVITTPDNKADVPRLDVAGYAVRIRTERGFSISPWTYLPIDVETPILPGEVTNLKLNDDTLTTFATRDASFSWDDVVTMVEEDAEIIDKVGSAFVWKDYEVRVLTTADALLRTEYTRSPNYVYTFDKNAQDALLVGGITARRAFKIEVRLRGHQGQVSSPAVMSVSNPTPAVTPINAAPTINGMYAEPSSSLDPDVKGIMIWASTTPGFAPNEGTLVYKGPFPANVSTLAPGESYRYRWAFYDDFDSTDVAVSNEATLSTYTVAEIDPQIAESLEAVADAQAQIAALIEDNASVGEALLAEIVAAAEKGQEAKVTTYNDRITRITDHEALVTVVDGVVATVGANYAAYLAQVELLVNADEANASAIEALATTVGTNYAEFLSEVTLRTDADSAFASALESLETTVNGNKAEYDAQVITFADADTALANSINSLATTVNDNKAEYDAQVTVFTDADTALSNSLASLSATVDDNRADYDNQVIAFANADAAAATRIDSLFASNGAAAVYNNDPSHQNWPVANALPTNVVTSGTAPTTTRQTSGVIFGEKALRAAGTSTATTGYQRQAASMKPASVPAGGYVVCEWTVTLVSGNFQRAGFEYRLNYTSGYKRGIVHLFDKHASPTVGKTYRGTALVALTDVSPTGSVVDQTDFLWLNNSTIFTTSSNSTKTIQFDRVSWREATAEEIAAGVTLPAISASVDAETTARIEGDNALTVSVNTLNSTVGGHTATLSSHAGTLATLDGKTQAYLDIVAAAGANPAFIKLLADSYGSNIMLAAQSLGLFNAGGSGELLKVLEIVGGTAKFSSPIEIQVGSAKLVLGPGFGASSDLVMWFGPTMAQSAMTKANATFWMDTAGSAYFGGTLSAGVLRNSGQSSNLSATDEFILGPFGTNGDPKIVTVNWYYQIYGARDTNPTTQTDTVAATVTLYRSIGGGAYTEIASQSVSAGSAAWNVNAYGDPVDSPNPMGGNTGFQDYDFTGTKSITFSFTDTNTSTGDFSYKAVLSRTGSFTPGGTLLPSPYTVYDSFTQRLGIVSVEE